MKKLSVMSFLFFFTSLGFSKDDEKVFLVIENYVNNNYQQAENGWKYLAEKYDDDKAQFRLGIYYFLGEGLNKDLFESIKWLKRSALNGNIYAQYKLGKLYETNEKIINHKEAKRWYLMAAEKGNHFAQYKLGKLFENRKNSFLNIEYAYMWLKISAALGNEMAIQNYKILEKKMSISQLENAMQLTSECFINNFQNCK